MPPGSSAPLSDWGESAVERLAGHLAERGAPEEALSVSRTELGWRLQLEDGSQLENGRQRASINVDFVAGALATVEVVTRRSWLKDFDTRTAAERDLTWTVVDDWFLSVLAGDVAERWHRIGGITVARELLVRGERKLTSGLPSAIRFARFHPDEAFLALRHQVARCRGSTSCRISGRGVPLWW